MCRLCDPERFRHDAPMGLRGPLPSSDVEFRGRAIVLRARTPAIHVKEHPLADARGYVSIHRLVASEVLGRWVTRGEAVKPIDGDPWNWAASNLRVQPLAASLPKAKRARPRAPAAPPKAR
jgi:hypothetical protein